MTIDRTQGGGPWTFQNEQALDPGQSFRIDFKDYEKGRLRAWSPMDSAVIKNFSSSERVRVIYNGQFEYVVDPNGVDTFDRTGIARFKVTNEGSNPIDPGNVVVSTAVEPYGADDEALETKQRPPLKRMARNFLGL